MAVQIRIISLSEGVCLKWGWMTGYLQLFFAFRVYCTDVPRSLLGLFTPSTSFPLAGLFIIVVLVTATLDTSVINEYPLCR